MVGTSKKVDIENKILTALPHEELVRILPHLVSARLEKGEVIYVTGDRIRYVYFPSNGLISLRCVSSSGSTVEVAMVGDEGIIGYPVILGNWLMPYEVTVQITTDVLRIKADDFQEEFNKRGALYHLTLRYLNLIIAEISQSSLCHRFHTVEEGLIRWLLIAHDRLFSSSLNVTHETISNSLGVPRTGVTMAAGALQRAGIIRYTRGKIVILDRARLEASSCECFRIVHDELNRFSKEQIPSSIS
ncbi:MAG TPA: Crp/Fnr family transcriptional regulator [Pyrinomonadaceae bacterium]|jgi:CRP-like cAMP-binding protein|nr:Crp/Fnr family transcriptional regulator [Pyrinomonadaceae bacterium]